MNDRGQFSYFFECVVTKCPNLLKANQCLCRVLTDSMMFLTKMISIWLAPFLFKREFSFSIVLIFFSAMKIKNELDWAVFRGKLRGRSFPEVLKIGSRRSRGLSEISFLLPDALYDNFRPTQVLWKYFYPEVFHIIYPEIYSVGRLSNWKILPKISPTRQISL